MPLFRSMQDKLDTINGTLREQITGIRVVRAFVREAYETEPFTKANKDITQLSLKIGQLFVLMFPIITVILNVATGAVLWFGGQRVDAELVDVGGLTAFLQYLLQILAAVMMGTFMAMMLPRSLVCARRITGVLSHEPSITPPKDTVTPTTNSGTVEFRNVSFSYAGADAPVLEDISFTATPGTTTAIIGSTGAGKTTMVNLLMRFYDIDSGRIIIDGHDTAHMPRTALRSQVGMVLQDAVLFEGTIMDNIRYGRLDATDDEVIAAAKATYVDRFVHSLPEGYDTVIDQDGGAISAGERQLITIARAFLAQPALLILDEATSSVDTRTEVLVQEAMNALRAERTSFVIAHRLSTIRDADLILVMENGGIVEQGSHEELLRAQGAYSCLHQSQFNKA